MSFLPVTTTFFAALHDASVEHFLFDALRGRLLLTLLLDSDKSPSHYQQQIVLSGIHNGADVEQVQRVVNAALANSSRPKLEYRLDEFYLLPKDASDCLQGSLSVRLTIDHLPPLQLHCQKITRREVNFT